MNTDNWRISVTTAADDIDMLISAIDQIRDVSQEDIDDITVSVPVRDTHAKYWPEVSVRELVSELEKKYMDAERTNTESYSY